ncbi:MAG: N4-gp56 family major capsid protein [Ignisphaera sp.]|nr:N4-gp56 family major capsid protein [Ignisphaera sp.]
MSAFKTLESITLGVISHAGTMKFNSGGYTTPTSSVGSQFNEKFWSKVAVKAARRYMTFSQLGDQLIQPKNYGDTIVKYAEVPIIHQLNINDQGIDANGAVLIKNKWYSYDVNGAMLAPTTGSADKASALAVVGTVTIKSGNGNMWGGDNSISVIKGSFPVLGEDGGKVNAVGMIRQVLTAKVTEFGFHIPFTQKMIDMDSETGLLARMAQEVGIAQGEIREKQIMMGLLAASETNRVIAGTASSIGAIGAADIIDFQDIRSMQQSLKFARVPKQTKIIDGSTNFGTTVVGAGYCAFVGQELLPTLEDMTYASVNVWKPVESYASAGTLMENEIGKISNTRFVEVMEMGKYDGAGALSNDATNDVDAANRYQTSNHYDVFPVLYVGTDSFGTVGFEGDVARVNTIMPKADAYNDPFGKKGAVSISWYFGMLVYRPERIRQIATAAQIS